MPIGTPHRPENNHATWVALVFSLLLHIPLVFIVGLAAVSPEDEALADTNFDVQEEFSIDLVTEPEEEEPEEDKPDEKLQFVTLPAPGQEKRPDEAKYADQYDETADKEQVKKALPGAVQKPAAPQPTPVEPPSEQEPTEEEPTEEPPAEEATEQQRSDETEDGIEARPEEQRRATSPPTAQPKELFPRINDSQAAEMLGEGGSMDYLRDVDEGDKTLLNRKRTRYWAFFDRVKRQVSKQWSPVSEYRKRDPYGNVYGVKDRYSTVDVTLNGDGTVRRLYLSRASGLDFFDDEAVRAIQSAGPFHNPPEGLKDEDGLVHFTFGFYFEISSGQFRFIRVRN
jgi:TonB family protein